MADELAPAWNRDSLAPSPCWKYIEIEAFRGFGRRTRVELDATAVVVTGANGTGKTSFFDAMQWLLIGDVPRLKARRYRTTEEHIVNAYEVGPARVSARLNLRGHDVLLTRSGNRSGSDLAMEIDGQRLGGASATSRLAELLTTGIGSSTEEALFSSGLLQQDEIRHVLNTNPSDRFEQMSRLLGLRELEAFESDAQASSKRANEELKQARDAVSQAQFRWDAARTALAEAERAQAALPMPTALMHELAEMLAEHRRHFELALPTTQREIASLVGGCRSLEAQLEQYVALQRSTLNQGIELGNAQVIRDELVGARAAVTTLREEVAGRQGMLATLRTTIDAARAQADNISRLAEIAVPLLSETCPVCGQRIADLEAVVSDLTTRAGDNALLLNLGDQWADVTAEVDERVTQQRSLEAEISALELRRAQAEEQELRRADMQSLVTTINSGELIRPVPRMGDAGIGMRTDAVDIRRRASSVRVQLEATLGALTSIERGSQLPELVANAAEAESLVAGARARLESYALASTQMDTLAKASTRSRRRVIERRIDVLRPLVENIYSRLDPHPTFRAFRFESDILRNKGTLQPRVADAAAGIEVNPSLTFSSAQVNMVALTYFLALAWSGGDRALPFVALDDPLQEMDDVNVLAFADLARHLRANRQVIVATHERRYATLLRRKLSPRLPGEAMQTVTFTGWSPTGPAIRQESVEYTERVGSLRLLA